jgi:hypothetical protein
MNMFRYRHRRLQLLFALSLLFVTILPAQAGPRAQATQFKLFLPLITIPAAASPFGFDVHYTVSDAVLQYIDVSSAKAKWARAGDVRWSDIEPVRGGGYHWEAMAGVDANIQRLRAAQIEPTLIIQRSPAWAQRVPGRLCSPPKPEYIADFARFTHALAARYSSTVNYWEIWNEPDVAPNETSDGTGMGCWLDPSLPDYGGAYYGEVVKQVAPAIKAANPNAKVIAGALLYAWPDDSKPRAFLNGILASGAGPVFDMLSFHAYGEWGAGDLLINKTARIRQILSSYGMPNKPLIATEIAATCGSTNVTSCPPNFEAWKQRQANYAARIYAEAIALNLAGAFWYTLVSQSPGFNYSQLIDDQNGTLAPRESYYAFLNSAKLLRGARYVGSPVKEPPPDQIDKVQALPFRKATSTLYVLWVPQIDFPEPYNLAVPVGARAECTDHLDQNPPAIYACSDSNRDGMIPRAVNGLPQYVEVFDQ